MFHEMSKSEKSESGAEDPTCSATEHGEAPPPPLDPRLLRRAAAILRAAGDPGRLWLLARLARGESCVTELAEESGEELSTISQRLKVLRNEDLVTRRRDGKHIFYGLPDRHVIDLLRNALDHAEHS